MVHTLPLAQFSAMVKQQPDTAFLHQPINRQLECYSWREVNKQALSIAAALMDMGLNKGDSVGIVSKNCAQWFISDIAIMMAGLISIPIYPTANRETIAHIANHSDCKVVFVGKLDDPKEVDAGLDSNIKRIAFPYPTATCQYQWSALLKTPALKNVHRAQATDTLSIVYTSGSTGKPKGVVLTHSNFAAAANDALHTLQATPNDKLMSYLPLAHITERGLIEIPSFYSGSKIYFVESLDTFIDDVKIAQPNFFVSVPRLWSKFQSEILQKMPDKKLQFLLNIPVVNHLVKKKIRAGLGLSQARILGSGSAPISPAILQWYKKLGMPISEGWGMTETSGMSCVNIPFKERAIGSIGKPLSSVNIRIADNAEIEIKGAAIFTQYYQNDEATAQSFTDDGWFKTGDMGACSSDGDYSIIGRIKEQFKTGKGKYVAPAPIENLLGRNTDIEASCVIGQGRKQPVALVMLSEQQQKENATTRAKLAVTLDEVNQQLESHQHLDAIIVVKDSWSIENNLLTPTLKIKRAEIEKRYQVYLTNEDIESVCWEAG